MLLFLVFASSKWFGCCNFVSLLQNPSNKVKCARFFKKCLDFLDEPDHLVMISSPTVP